MLSGIYAIANIGRMKLYVCDANSIQQTWSSILAQLNSGIYPNAELQAVWNAEGGKRHFTFHLKQDLIDNPDIIGIEQLTEEIKAN